MEQGSTTSKAADTGLFAGEAWFDPIEVGIRERVRGFIEELLEQERRMPSSTICPRCTRLSSPTCCSGPSGALVSRRRQEPENAARRLA